MTGHGSNPHFEFPSTIEEARELLTFEPRLPRHPAAGDISSIAVHVRDHRMRLLRPEDRTLELHYRGFGLSESGHDADEARRRAVETSYGAAPIPIEIAGHPGRAFEPGPEPPPDDPDGPMPAVVVWHDDGMVFFLASNELTTNALMGIAGSVYQPDPS